MRRSFGIKINEFNIFLSKPAPHVKKNEFSAIDVYLLEAYFNRKAWIGWSKATICATVMRRFFIENHLHAEAETTVTGNEAHHIKTVLRLRVGDSIELIDGSGYAYASEIKTIAEDRVQVYVHEKYPTGAESNLRLTLAIGFLKEKKMDFLVRHLTELGITRLLPVLTARSIANPPAKKISARISRWQTIAKEAVKQSRRGRIPEISAPAVFNDALQFGEYSDKKLLFWENAESALTNKESLWPGIEDVFLMIGPEGGFTGEEALKAGEHGFTPISMGPRILRAETAAIAACTLIQCLLGDICKKSP